MGENACFTTSLRVRLPRSRNSSAKRSRVSWTCSISRRDFMAGSGALALTLLTPSKPAEARGLVLLPLQSPLENSYYFMRAGESKYDALGVIKSNPVEKLLVENGLTEKGHYQAVHAADKLEKSNIGPFGDREFWIWTGTEAKASETAEILMTRLNMRRENVVPEYSYLDCRGMGVYEGVEAKKALPVIRSMDETDHYLRMDLGEDGTPNESIHDVFLRMRQLISKTETMYQACDIVLVSPDSYTLSVLECALRNEELRHYGHYSYEPGELRAVVPKLADPYPLKTSAA
uniref:Twin-arginine translocation signal domain-containing protein n=1 Tax=Rhodosorus marinus TaxID=101924 RepID=A0A7S2ZUZ5_9RHOD|mmetsp:Transcript_33662/g.132583  ORF Transcript_33662/g.132583 Transcript_33662/m.132583 type:complete len:289 (+) Transcript_33662:168-1034(+)|eukprot:CAMPEP_0113963816 /NCGR_PEP_ID=MMETSP0011_2-20120614/6747_1 /TAXON_ID=101924 /ORGANISM="Rhodosorus marinus" /LENGTH=288 /DNA_ID=CAMNT_0000975955 /DNA_START=102 /DNA_END=968 /DNA_ORIENTATION=- /assembly_acc=CAM_ASM_000156